MKVNIMLKKMLIAAITILSFTSNSYADENKYGKVMNMPQIIEVIDDGGNTIQYNTSKLNTAHIYEGAIKFTVNGIGSKCWLPRLGNLKHDFNFVLIEESGKEFDVRVTRGRKILGECQGNSNILKEMYITEK